ncbi:MAG: sugar phosphate isomerase/epimerase [Thermoflexibacter sp.]|jgi:sugar phosphate isomerase/epimerase|nr:sugar phosphate isomerase/epimerase [Thermoflexibacter sp.]
MDKRNFIKTLALGATYGMLTPSLSMAGIEENRKKLKNIGLIFNTIGAELKKDVPKTLEKVAKIGYKEVEFSKVNGYKASEIKKILDDLDLRAVAGGGVIKQFVEDEFYQMVEEANLLGKKYLVCYWEWLDSGENKSLDDFKKVANQFNLLGEKCKKEGLQFAFHNHDKEFKITEGRVPYEVILENINPELVTMELDLYWATKGGANPATYLEKYPSYFSLFHVKDMDKTENKDMACVGQGRIDFKEIFSKATHVKHFIVEHDKPANPMECIAQSYDFLKKVRF